MKKTKQILAILGCILLIGLYVSTLVFALIGNENTMNFFWASVYATVVVPVLIWAYTFIYRLLKDHYSGKEEISAKEDQDASSEKNK